MKYFIVHGTLVLQEQFHACLLENSVLVVPTEVLGEEAHAARVLFHEGVIVLVQGDHFVLLRRIMRIIVEVQTAFVVVQG